MGRRTTVFTAFIKEQTGTVRGFCVKNDITPARIQVSYSFKLDDAKKIIEALDLQGDELKIEFCEAFFQHLRGGSEFKYLHNRKVLYEELGLAASNCGSVKYDVSFFIYYYISISCCLF